MPRLGLWGAGTAFPRGLNELLAEVALGGVGMLELVAMHLKASGSFLCRTLSFQACSFALVDSAKYAALRDPARELAYDLLADLWCELFRELNEALDCNEVGTYSSASMSAEQFEGEDDSAEAAAQAPSIFANNSKRSQAAQAAAAAAAAAAQADPSVRLAEQKKLRQRVLTYFWGAHQRCFRSMCVALKVPAAVALAEAALAEGKCCVIGLQSTGDARATASSSMGSGAAGAAGGSGDFGGIDSADVFADGGGGGSGSDSGFSAPLATVEQCVRVCFALPPAPEEVEKLQAEAAAAQAAVLAKARGTRSAAAGVLGKTRRKYAEPGESDLDDSSSSSDDDDDPNGKGGGKNGGSGGGGASGEKVEASKKAPPKFWTGYAVFGAAMRRRASAKGRPTVSFAEVAARWRQLSPEQAAVFADAGARNKVRYEARQQKQLAASALRVPASGDNGGDSGNGATVESEIAEGDSNGNQSEDEIPELDDNDSDHDEEDEEDHKTAPESKASTDADKDDAAAVAMDTAEGNGDCGQEEGEPCAACGQLGDDDLAVLCDHCDLPFHMYCLTPPLSAIPDGDWFCDDCTAAAALVAAEAKNLAVAQADVELIGPALEIDGWQLVDSSSSEAGAVPGAHAPSSGWRSDVEAPALNPALIPAPTATVEEASSVAKRTGRARRAAAAAAAAISVSEKATTKKENSLSKNGARHLWSRTRRFFSWQGRSSPMDGRIVAFLPPSSSSSTLAASGAAAAAGGEVGTDDALWKNRLDADGTLEDLDASELARAQRRFKSNAANASILAASAPFDDEVVVATNPDGSTVSGKRRKRGRNGTAAAAATNDNAPATGNGNASLDSSQATAEKGGSGSGAAEVASSDALAAPKNGGGVVSSSSHVVEEIVWAQAGVHDPFWPGFIAEPSPEQRALTPLPKHCR